MVASNEHREVNELCVCVCVCVCVCCMCLVYRGLREHASWQGGAW